jgi:predicted kinase
MKKRIVITVGLPRSGKTTWAQAQGHPIVNPDSIRLAMHGHRFNSRAEPYVWAVTYTMVEALLLAGHDTVIVDATHITAKRRAPYVERFTEIAELWAMPIKTGLRTCLRRAQGDHEIIPVIRAMHDKFEPVKFKLEGFSNYERRQ